MSNIYFIRNSGYNEINTTRDQSLTKHTRESYGASPVCITMILGIIMMYMRVGIWNMRAESHALEPQQAKAKRGARALRAPRGIASEWCSETSK